MHLPKVPRLLGSLSLALGALACGGGRTPGVDERERSIVAEFSDEARTGETARRLARRSQEVHVPLALATEAPGRFSVRYAAVDEPLVEEMFAWSGGVELFARGDSATKSSEIGPFSERLRRARSEGPAAKLAFVSLGRFRIEEAVGPALARLEVGCLADAVGTELYLREDPRKTRLDLPAFAALATKSPALPVLLTRGRSVLYAGPLGPLVERDSTGRDLLHVPFGTDFSAYARAKRQEELLTLPPLPPLSVAASRPAPARWGLAVACLLVPALLSLAFLTLVRRLDRAHPEPRWLVAATFALGALGVPLAGALEAALAHASPWLDPRLAALGGEEGAWFYAFAVYSLVAGLVEESVKALAVFALAGRRKEFDEPIDGMVYAAAAALGFAFLENAKYFADSRLSPLLVIGRTLLSAPAHLFFSALWGAAAGRRLVLRAGKTPMLLWFLAAVLAHGAFDAFLPFDRLAPLALVEAALLTVGFLLLARRALRYAPVVPGVSVDIADERDFSTGRPTGFSLAVVGTLLATLALLSYVGWFRTTHAVETPGFYAVSVPLAALVALGARASIGLLPLAAVVRGGPRPSVTYAGTSRSVASISEAEFADETLLLRSSEGDLTLGPISEAVATELTATLGAPMLPLGAKIA